MENQVIKRAITSYIKKNKYLVKCQQTTRNLIAKFLKFYRTGPDTVLIIPDGTRGGNWLYEWCKCSTDFLRSGTTKTKVVYKSDIDSWIGEFPELQNITISKSDIKFKNIRVVGCHNNIEENFTKEEVKYFINNFLLKSKNFSNRIKKYHEIVDNSTLIINVRRGDYYSVDKFRQVFGINTSAYLQAAMKKVSADNNINKIFVISDDLEWCSNNLDFLNNYAPTIFEKQGDSMFDDLAMLSVARMLILTNTTFGYWGGYIASQSGCKVWTPNMHELGGLLNTLGRPAQHMSDWNEIFPELESGASNWLEA